MAEINIKNNGKKIGVLNTFDNNLKKVIISSLIGFTVLTTVGCTRGEEKEEIAIEQVQEYVRTYDNIEYTVQNNETISDIVYRYETRDNIAIKDINKIERDNNLEGKILREGKTILLSGVPQDKLEDFGYTTDYEIIGYEKKVEDVYEWMKSEKDYIVINDMNSNQVDDFYTAFNSFEELLMKYKYNDEAMGEEMLNELTFKADLLIDDFREITGLDFNYYHKAHKIEEKTLENNGFNLL